MRRYNLALIAITAGLGLSNTAIAGEAPNAAAGANSGGTVQTAGPGQAVPQRKSALRRIKRVGTSTAGANSFLPGVGLLGAALAGATAAASASSGDSSNPASPE